MVEYTLRETGAKTNETYIINQGSKEQMENRKSVLEAKGKDKTYKVDKIK